MKQLFSKYKIFTKHIVHFGKEFEIILFYKIKLLIILYYYILLTVVML